MSIYQVSCLRSYSPAIQTVEEKLFFQASDGSHCYELFASDGTITGTNMVKDINLGSPDSEPWEMYDILGALYFSAYDATFGRELWRSDGATPGTERVADINNGDPNSSPRLMTLVGDSIYFDANDGLKGSELWGFKVFEPVFWPMVIK
jgi:ELWxxDGT repeat protein